MVNETVPKDILDKLNAGITITSADLDIRDLSHTQDSIKVGDGTDFLLIDGAGKIGISSMPSVTVTATDLDIRDLTSASDSVEVLQDTAADLKTEVSTAAGVGLPTLSYGSSDGGTTWWPIKVDINGKLGVV